MVDDVALAAAPSGSSGATRHEESPGLRQASEALTALYEIHDFLFTADKAEKREMLKEASAKVQSKLDDFGEGSTNHERARVAYIRGRALDAFEEYNKDAEASLARAVKLEPSNVEAWNALGDCFWKKKDLNSASDCFQQALAKSVNKESLRKLSMVLRQLPTKTFAEAKDYVQKSVKRAKEALKLDLTDPESWYVLGNAYVTVFFKVTHSPADLERALQAYRKAEAHGGDTNPDLYFNKANVLQFQEDFAEAAEAFKRAVDLDPSLPGEEAVEAIQLRVRRTVDLLHKKGRVKEKRLNQLVAPLSEVRLLEEHANYELVDLQALRIGENAGKAVVLKLVLPLGQQGHPPNSFIMADKTSRCTVLSVYQLEQEASKRLGDKDVFTILSPLVKRVKYLNSGRVSTSSDEVVTEEEGTDGFYDTIQIVDPTSLYVNGKPIEGSFLSPAVVRLDNRAC